MQFLGRKKSLHAFKQLALLAANVVGKQGSKACQANSIQRSPGRAIEGGAEFHVFTAKLADKGAQFRKPLGRREKNALLGVKMEPDLLVKDARDLPLPTADLVGRRTAPAFDADAKCQRVLMLARERDEGRVAEHANILTPLYENTLAG